MHIVILSDTLPPDSPGGAGKIAWLLGQGLIGAGQRVTFITSSTGPSRVEVRQGIPVHVLYSKYPERFVAWLSLFNPWTVWPLNRLLRELKPDVVHAHNIHQHLSYHSMVIGHASKAATVFTSHDVMPFAYAKLDRFIDPKCPDQMDGWDYRLPFGYNWRQARLRWNPARNLSVRHTMKHYTDMRIAVSYAHKAALEANGLPPFDVVYNGIDIRDFEAADAGMMVLRQRYKLEGQRVILFGGRINIAKGEAQLMAALRQVKQKVSNFRLLVLARPSVHTERMLHEHADLAEHIVLGGWLDGVELATAYRMADIVASPSVYADPFPTVNLEGMAAGAVPVTTCFGGSREAVIDGETGFVVNPYDIEALADRMVRLLTDEPLRQRMAEAGRARYLQQFTLEKFSERMINVYERALAQRRSSGRSSDR